MLVMVVVKVQVMVAGVAMALVKFVSVLLTMASVLRPRHSRNARSVP